MKESDAIEFGKMFVNGTPFAGYTDAWVHIAAIVKKAGSWEVASQICQDYGMVSDRHITAELAAELTPDGELKKEVEHFLGRGEPVEHPLQLIDAFLPQGNRETEFWGDSYRIKLKAIRSKYGYTDD